MSAKDPRLRHTKIYWAKGRQYAYFRPAHARLYSEPYSDAFFAEVKAINDNFEATRRRPAAPQQGECRRRRRNRRGKPSTESHEPSTK